MKVDIVSLSKKYRGMARSIAPSDFPKIKKAEFDVMIEKYFEYIDAVLNLHCENLFYKLIPFYDYLKSYGIKCEMIVYDNCKISDAFGAPVEFLGIDITHDMCESLLEENDKIPDCYLNDNCLLNSEDDCRVVVSLLDTSETLWEPCWIYKVIV